MSHPVLFAVNAANGQARRAQVEATGCGMTPGLRQDQSALPCPDLRTQRRPEDAVAAASFSRHSRRREAGSCPGGRPLLKRCRIH